MKVRAVKRQKADLINSNRTEIGRLPILRKQLTLDVEKLAPPFLRSDYSDSGDFNGTSSGSFLDIHRTYSPGIKIPVGLFYAFAIMKWT